MKKFCTAIFLFASLLASSQSLTVEKIMQNQQWIGSSPTNVFWSYDSKSVLFNWNPEKNISDSTYRFTIGSKEPVKETYNHTAWLTAIHNGVYNKDFSAISFSYKGDIFLLNIKSNKTIRITQTEELETAPKFIADDEWIVYNRNQNLFGWNCKTGATKQLTNLVKTTDNALTTASTNMPAGRGTRNSGAVASTTATNQQEQWLKQNQLATSTILQQRKNKRDLREAFLRTIKESDTLKTIVIGDKNVQALEISPDGRYITYQLYTAANAKRTIVPDYVTESGFTADIPNRTKVGAQQGSYDFYVYDKIKDTVFPIATDSIPGITELPDYAKEQTKKLGSKKAAIRPVIVNTILWNANSTVAILDIRSQDNKDRWIMQLDAETGKLKLLDRQRDEAWIGGPGIDYNASIGWINDTLFYFQSEASGYSHVYTYNIGSAIKTQITKGNYEVQQLVLSKTKQYFYLVSNEEHPGKQNWYKINIDGSNKEKITSLTGGYDISLSPDEKYIAYRYSYITKPFELYVQENASNKKMVQVTNKAMSEAFKSYAWRDTKIFTITARDGQPIYAKIFEPAANKKNNAAIVFVHGAGYLQNVHYGWSNNYPREYMFNNLLADKGYTVIDIDYRASSGYGRNWRTGIYRYMGGKDLDDEVDATKYLVKELGIDSTRIGIYGGSYGGFMTLMALFTQPTIFKAGAALRSVTDWAHYNHGYTSNILNEPFTDSIAYARSSPINFVSGLKNHLLICHGMVDQNVNFQDDVRLVQRLIELGKDNWELAVYPVEDHGFVEPSSWIDEYKRILKLFDTWLLK